MTGELIYGFVKDLRWDMVSTLIIAIVLYLILIYKRHRRNKVLKANGQRPRDILVVTDLLYTIATSATVYGGISAMYYSIKGHLLFNQNLIISQEYIILFSGGVLFVLGILAYKKAIRDIQGENQ
ncbi:MAG: hypothetical protein ABIH63_02955 [archaeon]